jgi:hypothetical protein
MPREEVQQACPGNLQSLVREALEQGLDAIAAQL